MSALLLRTCGPNGEAYGDFVWPLEVGAEVVAPDWDPSPECGGGLHGLLWGEGDGSLLGWSKDAVWLVVEADEWVNIDGAKVKCPRCVVRFVGDRLGATDYLLANGAAGRAVVGAVVKSGDGGTSTSGYMGTSTSGYKGTSTSGDGGTSTSGYGGTSTSGYKGTSTSGDGGTSTSGRYGTAQAGEHGELRIRWWDGERYRCAVGYVGENGIKPDTPYRVNDLGEFEEAA